MTMINIQEIPGTQRYLSFYLCGQTTCHQREDALLDGMRKRWTDPAPKPQALTPIDSMRSCCGAPRYSPLHAHQEAHGPRVKWGCRASGRHGPSISVVDLSSS
jgi:hypothetical protein